MKTQESGDLSLTPDGQTYMTPDSLESEDPASDATYESPGPEGRSGKAGLPVVDSRHYDVARELARGGMGRILAAHDRRLGRQVAIKELLRRGPKRVRRFEREVLVTARLQHPGIVPIYEAGRWPTGEPFYAMKKVEGKSLEKVIADTKGLSDRLAVLPHVIDVVDALGYAHSQQVIHRDLKPENVLVGAFGETVVIDWGLAKDISGDGGASQSGASIPSGAGITVAGTVIGTPAYMAPEQARGKKVDERADVYALGAILYFVLAGRPPYEGNDSMKVVAKVISGPPERLDSREPGVPPELVAIVEKAMAREPEDRYATAGDLASELQRFQTGQLVAAHRYTRAELVRRWVKRYRAALTVGLVALGVVAVMTVASVREIIAEKDRAEAARVQAEQARELAEAEREKAATRADEVTIIQARTWLERDPVEAIGWLKGLSKNSSHWRAARLIASDARSRGIWVSLPGHSGKVWSAAYSPDGRYLASSGDDPFVLLHDLQKGTSRKLEGHQGWCAT